MRRLIETTLALATSALICLAPPAGAVVADPAVAQIESLDAALLSTMKQGKALGYKGRYARLQPAIERALDLDAMTRFAVGPTWTTLSPAQRAGLASAFRRMTIANYAKNFDAYDGESFSVSGVETRGPDKLVRTQLARGNGAPVTLTYRMRTFNGVWKVIDVYYQGSISELTTRRSDFAATLRSGGPQALIQHLDALADKLSR